MVATGILATAIELYGFIKDSKYSDESLPGRYANLTSGKRFGIQQQDVFVQGPQTNITNKVQGDVFSGQFATGTIIKPSVPVNLTQIIKQQEKPPIPRIQPPPRDFTGRDDERGRLLKVFDRGATIIGLRGTGGIGKTALALVLADKLKSRFPDGQIFLKLEGTSPNPLEPVDAMAQVIRAFRGFEESLPEDQNELQRLYNSVLEGKSVFLLLDNAADDKQILPLLPPMGCAVLVTSRKKFTLPGMPEPFLLETLKPSESSILLLKICPRIGNHTDELAKLCGYLPLALRAAASLLAVKSDLSPSSYLEELRSERTRLEKIGREGVDLDLEASLDLNYGCLPTETASIFRQLSVFPSDFDAAAEEIVCQDEGHQHLSELVRRSLVEYQLLDKESEGRYHLHDLVRIFAASRLQAVENLEAQQRHAEHYKNVLTVSNEFYNRGGKNVLAGLGLFDMEWANIQAGQAWAEKNLEGKSFAAELSKCYPDAGASVLDLRLHPRENIRWRKTALSVARQLKDRGAEGVHLGHMGSAYSDLGDLHKAIDYHENALAITRESGDRRSEGVTLGNLGVDYYAMGDFHKAIDYHDHALAITREIGDRRGEGAALGNLGLVHADLGDYGRAIYFYEQHLAIAREIGDKSGDGNAMGNLGLAYVDLGEASQAMEYFGQHLAIAREIGDRRGEGTALGNLGMACANLGVARSAIEYFGQHLAIAREIGDKRGEGNALGNLGTAYYSLGEASLAIDYYKQHLTIAREIGDRKGEGNALFNMSLALGCLKKRAEAVTQAKEALQIYEQIESPSAEQVRQQLVKWQK